MFFGTYIANFVTNLKNRFFKEFLLITWAMREGLRSIEDSKLVREVFAPGRMTLNAFVLNALSDSFSSKDIQIILNSYRINNLCHYPAGLFWKTEQCLEKSNNPSRKNKTKCKQGYTWI